MNIVRGFRKASSRSYSFLFHFLHQYLPTIRNFRTHNIYFVYVITIDLQKVVYGLHCKHFIVSWTYNNLFKSLLRYSYFNIRSNIPITNTILYF